MLFQAYFGFVSSGWLWKLFATAKLLKVFLTEFLGESENTSITHNQGGSGEICAIAGSRSGIFSFD